MFKPRPCENAKCASEFQLHFATEVALMLLDDVPETIDKWATRAIQIDTNYRQTMETMERIAGEKKNSKPSTSKGNMNKWNKKKEEKDPDAMDIDGMSDGKRAFLMRKGACFKCEEPGHLARDCKKDKGGKGKGKISPKKDLKAIHALFKGLTKAEQMELLALSEKKDEETEEEEKDKDF